MQSELTSDEINDLLRDVASVKEWFDEHGFITERQEEVMNEIVERGSR